MRFRTRTTTLAAALGACVLLPSVARAQVPNCADLDLPNAIYGTGGSAITGSLRNVAIALRSADPPITVLFNDPSACEGYGYFVAGSTPKAYRYWTPDWVPADGDFTCLAPEVAPDFAHMGNPVSECLDPETNEPLALPEGIKDFGGPVQTLNIIAHVDSNYNSISAEALHKIFSAGASVADVEPWNVDGQVVVRGITSFVHLLAAKSVKVDPSTPNLIPANGYTKAATGNTNQGTIDDVFALGNNTSPDSPLGYVSGSAASSGLNPTKVKTLAFQGEGQECAYWPDSTPNTTDRANVRSGSYQIWTTGHFFAPVDEDGDAENETVGQLIAWFTGALTSPGDLDVTRKVIEAGDVPLCAMRAQREGLFGAISSYKPNIPCDCYFESIATKTVPNYCDACDSDDYCASISDERPFCNYGFCELYRED